MKRYTKETHKLKQRKKTRRKVETHKLKKRKKTWEKTRNIQRKAEKHPQQTPETRKGKGT